MDKDKAWGLYKLKLTGIFEPFKMYGMREYVSPAIEQVMIQTRILIARLEDNHKSGDVNNHESKSKDNLNI